MPTGSVVPTRPNLTSATSIELRGRFGTAAELLAKFNPDMQTAYCRDVERVHFGKAPRIGVVAEAYGRGAAESWLIVQLNNLSEFAGCREKLSPAQIEETARMMLEICPEYNLTEFMLFFQRFKRCEYGKFYGAVDPMLIMQALQTFGEQRTALMRSVRRRREAEAVAADELEYQRLKARYKARVPGAWTTLAAIDFQQYLLMGYDAMPDDELAREIDEIQRGGKRLPEGHCAILAALHGSADRTKTDRR